MLCTIMVALGVVAAGPTPALAEEIPQCNGQDAVVSKSVHRVNRNFVMTHANLKDIARGVAYHQEKAIESIRTVKASSTFTAEVGGSAGWAFATVEAKTSLTLHAEGSETSAQKYTERWDIEPAPRKRLFVFYAGVTFVKARWRALKCSRAPGRGTRYEGPVQSFTGTRDGTLLCPARRYSPGSTRHTIAVSAGC